VDITAFGRQGEVINQYMSKGRSILVEGRLNFRQWTNKEGQKRSKLDVVVENFTFLGGGGGGQGGGGRQNGGSDDQPPPIEDTGGPVQDSEIPF
jgi:single-strand DNA-binding protein